MWLRSLAAIAIIAACIAFLVLINQPIVRYMGVGNSRVCSAQQMLNLPDKIDLVTIGSSRIRQGFSPKSIQEASGGRINVVYNLGRPQRNISRSYYILKDLVDRDIEIKTAVVEADIEALQGSHARKNVLNKVNIYLWPTYSQVIDYETRFGRGFADYVRGFSDKIRQNLVIAAVGEVWASYRDSNEPAPLVCAKRTEVTTNPNNKSKQQQRKERLTARFGDPDQSFNEEFKAVDTQHTQIELYFLDQIRQLADGAGINLVFVRPFGYYDRPLSPDVIAKLQEIVPEYRYPPAQFVRDNNENFADGAHLNDVGRNNYSTWLAQALLAEFPDL